MQGHALHGRELAKHRREQTPHLAAYVKPLTKDPKGRGNGWTLSDRALGLGGNKEALSQLQDDYAKAMAPFGLRRGIKGSRATHQKTSEWRKQMAKPLDAPVVKPNPPKPLATERAEVYGQRVADHVAKAIFDQMKAYHQQAKTPIEEAWPAGQRARSDARGHGAIASNGPDALDALRAPGGPSRERR